MITEKNESKDLTKYISNQKWNNDKCRCECKKHYLREKDYISNPAICSCENGKYLARIIDNSVVTCDEVIDVEETKTVTTNFNDKSAIGKSNFFYILRAFLLIPIVLLIAPSIYYYLTKYKSKQTYYITNDKLIYD